MWGPPVTFTSDTLIHSWDATAFDYSLDSCVTVMESYFGDEELVWLYNTFDEAPSRQWKHMVDDTSAVDDYIPNLFTQKRHLVGTDSLPTFEEVDPQGVFSWLKHAVDVGDGTHTVVCVFALLHTLDWAGYSDSLGTFHDQANSIKSYLNMEYQEYGNPTVPLPVSNWPDYFLFDCYPIRQVGVTYLTEEDSTYDNHVSASLDTILLVHFEEGMDSTFITVRETALDQERDIPAFYYPQVIGKTGGDVMWNDDETALQYGSYAYRVPTPQEFLMNCNIALMRDIRALFPYCMRSYQSTQGALDETSFTSGFLDNNNLPFDAPYEEWVYTDRWRSDFDVIPPDSFPPFADSCRLCDDFDPLWNLPARPDTVSGSQRTTENYLMWKFTAYGRLWKSMRDTFAQVATIAPEYTNLHWWEDYAYCLEIVSLNDRVEPHIRLFVDDDENGYAYYVNRNCYDDSIAVNIVLWPDTVPFTYNTKLLDHSRRFLLVLEDDLDYDYHFFSDTLDPGQARLVQFFTGNLPADIRITDPDITASGGGALDLRDFTFAAHTDISVNATFYNMGTVGASDVIVHLNDLSDGLTVLDSDTISFSGLSSSGYTCDSVEVSFTWRTDSDDIGVHILEVAAESVTSEPDTTDNRATAVFQITPRDYATTVLANSWNMSEATGSGVPAWHTNDVISTTGWDSTYSDSISGMFEGSIPSPNLTNKLELNLGSGSSDNIPTRLYNQFSLIGKADGALTITAHWRHENLSYGSLELDTGLGSTWGVVGPFDLTADSSGWASDDVVDLWLEFSGANVDRGIRIGWVKLTE